MTENKTTRMTDLVAKLLRQAEDVVGTPEEAVFQAKAFELVAKYGLDMGMVEAHKSGLDTTQMVDAISWELDFDGKYIPTQTLLMFGMSRALHCRAVYYSGRKRMVVYGMPRHIERLQMLWQILLPQMLRLVDIVRPDAPFVADRGIRGDYDKTGNFGAFAYDKQTGGKLRAYRRAWMAGFAQAVTERITQQETIAIESTGGALTLYRSDQQRAEQAMNEAHPRLRAGRSTRFNAAGYQHGRRDGSSAAMNRSLN